VDLMDALKKSVAQSKKTSARKKKPKRKSAKRAAG
jgi:non-homologous end joining protein Ku